MGLVPLEEEEETRTLFLHYEDTAGRRSSANQEVGSRQTPNLPAPFSETSQPRNREKRMFIV